MKIKNKKINNPCTISYVLLLATIASYQWVRNSNIRGSKESAQNSPKRNPNYSIDFKKEPISLKNLQSGLVKKITESIIEKARYKYPPLIKKYKEAKQDMLSQSKSLAALKDFWEHLQKEAMTLMVP